MSDICSSRRPNFVRLRLVLSAYVTVFFFRAHKNVSVVFTKLKVPDNHEGSHVTTELGVLNMEIHDTLLTPRILRLLLDVSEHFWTPGSSKCWLSEFCILTLTH